MPTLISALSRKTVAVFDTAPRIPLRPPPPVRPMEVMDEATQTSDTGFALSSEEPGEEPVTTSPLIIETIDNTFHKNQVRRKRVQRRARYRSSYSTKILRILREMHPKLSLSKQSVSVVNSLVSDTIDCILNEAGKLLSIARKQTLNSI